ncbi:carboxymuconolactone decarboxylase family protein [Alkalibaculum bacchi]|uniref:carboxymuconolactone decarboxylase family protein n=1 Tax=Alkalibaculum bacchi TaxID=645887 RepID=UPI0026EF3481|nr:carboxymuconolactone decarboxylase family protein [Alkalibaculum bacchi]
MNSKQKEIKELLSTFLEGMRNLSSEDQQVYRPFQDLINVINNPGELEEKAKVLISIGIATYSRNEQTLAYHINEAYKLGAKQEEIAEAAMVSVIPGGMDAMTFFVTYVKDAIEALQTK